MAALALFKEGEKKKPPKRNQVKMSNASFASNYDLLSLFFFYTAEYILSLNRVSMWKEKKKKISQMLLLLAFGCVPLFFYTRKQ